MNLFTDLLAQQKEPEFFTFTPDVVPVSMLDVDRSPPMCMDLPMSDPCPQCGGYCMSVGDYVCWGFCYRCYDSALQSN